ncbi:MAG: hypothetical protein IPK63_15600 [Candidatus Competibacteraceae bacterium]|nr:hypothetical protein [Candidatus Competibacteraceae bacterium]
MTSDYDKTTERVAQHAKLSAEYRQGLCAGGLGYIPPQANAEETMRLAYAAEECANATPRAVRAVREAILLEAARLTLGSRNQEHGDPLPNMELLAYFSAPILSANVLPDGVRGALLMLVAKLARGLYNPHLRDTWIDLAAYAAIAGECAEAVRPRE